MTRTLRMLLAALTIVPAVLVAQEGSARKDRVSVEPATLLKPLAENWATYSGDYTGRRYSTLTQVNQSTVKNLTLAWVSRVSQGPGDPGRATDRTAAPIIVGGHGPAPTGNSGNAQIKSAVLAVDGVLYVTAPDHVWAIDARDGHELWRYFWKTRGGTHVGHRGAALWHNYLYFETPDNYLVSLEAATGKERWNVEIADFDEQYFSTPAPIVVDNHLLVGTGNDLDMPGFLQSFNAETGAREWKFYTVPMNPGDPGLETWPSLDAARHGGGQAWLPGVYDPETRLYIFGTGNPTPAYTGVARKGDNLYTCSLVAVHVDTGKMAWYFQTSAHDTHDWDSAQTPILIDGTINGRPRKLVSTASRNGYFFTVDRVTGEHIVTSKYGTATNWAKDMRPTGVVEPDLEKAATIPGSLVSPVERGVTNWPPSAFSPQTGLFYVQERNGFNMLYLSDPDPRGSMGLGGKTVANVGAAPSFLTAIDYRTGKVTWRHEFPSISGGGGAGGVLATATNLVFTGDAAGNLVAFDARNGKPLWHSRIGTISNAPQTYMVDGRQYLLAAVGDTLYAFVLY
jgi:alcohol dehydrogenase (cytochrome c)